MGSDRGGRPMQGLMVVAFPILVPRPQGPRKVLLGAAGERSDPRAALLVAGLCGAGDPPAPPRSQSLPSHSGRHRWEPTSPRGRRDPSLARWQAPGLGSHRSRPALSSPTPHRRARFSGSSLVSLWEFSSLAGTPLRRCRTGRRESAAPLAPHPPRRSPIRRPAQRVPPGPDYAPPCAARHLVGLLLSERLQARLSTISTVSSSVRPSIVFTSGSAISITDKSS